jgi:integration host factor subunit beta
LIVTKSELIEIITAKQKHLPARDVELALKQILEIMSDALSQGERIEIRGFGSFSLHFRPESMCRISSPARTCVSASTKAQAHPSGTDRCASSLANAPDLQAAGIHSAA